MVVLAGCASDTSTKQSSIVVSAATSLTKAFEEMAAAFEAAYDGVDVRLNFGASSALAEQIVGGAPADVFASADEKNMTKVVEAKLVGAEGPVLFAANLLTIVTKPGNPSKVASLADLAGDGVVSLCGVDVPCGIYAAEALAKAGVTIAESKVTRGQNIAATLTAVSQGDAHAGIVYVDRRQGHRVGSHHRDPRRAERRRSVSDRVVKPVVAGHYR